MSSFIPFMWGLHFYKGKKYFCCLIGIIQIFDKCQIESNDSWLAKRKNAHIFECQDPNRYHNNSQRCQTWKKITKCGNLATIKLGADYVTSDEEAESIKILRTFTMRVGRVLDFLLRFWKVYVFLTCLFK